jgi:hypothetical protein
MPSSLENGGCPLNRKRKEYEIGMEVFSCDPLSPVIHGKMLNLSENWNSAESSICQSNASASFTGAAKEMLALLRRRES